MAFNDPIAEFLTKIRNAGGARHRHVDIMLSKMKKHLAEILKKQGFIENYLVNEEKQKMRIFLKYTKGRKPIIQNLKRISKPGLRRYTNSQEIPRVLGGMGIAIISTSKGVLDGEMAREQKVGGEILCYVW